VAQFSDAAVVASDELDAVLACDRYRPLPGVTSNWSSRPPSRPRQRFRPLPHYRGFGSSHESAIV